MENCLFCKFVSGELETTKLFENEDFIVIRDINPQAKNHYLAIPKTHYRLLADMTAEEAQTLGRIFATIPTLGKILGLENGFRVVINQGDDACQSVPHVHIHLLGGEKLGENANGKR